jgi:serine/threonine-protein kinase
MVCASCLGELEADAAFCGHCGRRTRRRGDSAIGTVVDNKYRIDSKIAVGGFGAIYRATNVANGVDVALKVLHADLANDASLAGRFLRESKTLGRLKCPHTVVTYERGEASDGTLYIAMELLEGESLLERVKKTGPMPWRDALGIMRAVCMSLAEAHEMGIIHRDLKPANIHIGKNGVVKVLDFGVAKLLSWSSLDDGKQYTLAGQSVGTLEYMAPEQIAGDECDATTDIFALGVVVYELVTGRRPFAEARDPASLITALLTERPPIPSQTRRVPGAVDQLLLRCLERDQENRFINVNELIATIDRILARPTPQPSLPPAGGNVHVEVENRRFVMPPVAYALATAEERKRPSQMHAFDLPVKGSVVVVDAPPEIVGSKAVEPACQRRVWIWLLGLAAGILAVAMILLAS